MPTLVLCYFGQGALMLTDDSALANPFFALVPSGLATYALVVLATCATVIASQALITGVFSLTHQAITLGFFPRMTITHTSHETEDQRVLCSRVRAERFDAAPRLRVEHRALAAWPGFHVLRGRGHEPGKQA